MFWGWGSWQSGRGWRWGGGFFFLPLVLCFGANWLLNGGANIGGFELLLIILVVIAVLPMIRQTLQRLSGAPDEKAKPKRDDAVIEPAPATAYVLGDDGEIIPIDEVDKAQT